MRVAIIGAGPSGMAQLRAFEAAQAQGAEVPEIVCFEKQSDWGGQWNYTWMTGCDAHGEPVHSSMYRNLWSNGPKEALEFADYTFDEHFGRPISSYPPRPVLWDYINGRLANSEVRRHVRFNTVVRWIDRASDDTFLVVSEDLVQRRTTREVFDHVIVASGHFWSPNLPTIDGLESFPGQVLHAHDFRGAESYDGLKVLLVGSSYSAEDIGSQAYKMGAALVTGTYRTSPMGYDWPDGFDERPLVQRFVGSTAHFADGTTDTYDVIILCTGYLHKYPYLPSELSLSGPNCVWPQGLYKGVVWQDDPGLFYIGAQDQWFTFNMFDLQAWYVRDVIMGRITLPDNAERQAEIDMWVARADALTSAEEEIRFQGSHLRDLMGRTDYPEFDVVAVEDIFVEWKDHKSADIMGYRDQSYRSVMTGTMAVQHHTPWLTELDDSMERYLDTSIVREDAPVG